MSLINSFIFTIKLLTNQSRLMLICITDNKILSQSFTIFSVYHKLDYQSQEKNIVDYNSGFTAKKTVTSSAVKISFLLYDKSEWFVTLIQTDIGIWGKWILLM